jgi:subtilisin family serine protease
MHKFGTLAAAILTALAALSSTSAHAAPSQNAAVAAPGRILVQPRAGLPASQFAALLKTHGASSFRKVGQSNLHIVQLPPGVSEADMVAKLSRNPAIKFAELDRRVLLQATANDPYFGSEYHLSLVGAPSAWDATYGAGVTIAILDSGVDGTHPDLVGNLLPGYNSYDNNTNTADVCGHGTAVAGTAAASVNNGIGVAGVAGQARILPVRIAYKDATSGSCYGYYSTIANGLTYAADNGARVANISYGGVAGSSSIISAAKYMQSKGGLVFVSAGNNGVDEGIAPTTSMIVVSATNSSDTRTSWSSYGSFVTLAAPGEYIYTTNNGGGYGAWNGTSFSSPLAAGVGALVMSANPGLSGADVENLLYSTAKDLGAAGRDPYYGYGRVDAARAVAAARAAAPSVDTTAPTASITSPSASVTVSGVVAVDVAAQDNVGVTSVELRVNGTTVATETAAPFSFAWDSTGVANGMANLVAVAYDAAGNAQSSSTVAVNVANATAAPVVDTTAPVVRITNPVAGAVAGTVVVTTDASDDSGAAGITQTIYVDNVARATGSGSTVSYSWNTKKEAVGTHTITVQAKDRAGNTSASQVAVTVGSTTTTKGGRK